MVAPCCAAAGSGQDRLAGFQPGGGGLLCLRACEERGSKASRNKRLYAPVRQSCWPTRCCFRAHTRLRCLELPLTRRLEGSQQPLLLLLELLKGDGAKESAACK